jgi:hypothetical protein
MQALLVLALIGQTEIGAPGSAEEPTKQSAERVLQLARQYEFSDSSDRERKFKLEAKPILTYSNPVRGDVYGDVFVWTLDGRPEVIAAIFDYRSEKWMDSEFHLLARDGTVAVRDARAFWQPSRPGVQFQAVEGASAPGESANKRLGQMRALAREFSVERNHPEQGKEELRMLVQPIFRYSSPQNKVADGAIFVFVEGTDPEAFLMLEAVGSDNPQWQFAFSRMNIVEFDGRRGNQRVWHVDPVDWDTMFDKQEPYAIVREKPRRGLERSP